MMQGHKEQQEIIEVEEGTAMLNSSSPGRDNGIIPRFPVWLVCMISFATILSFVVIRYEDQFIHADNSNMMKSSLKSNLTSSNEQVEREVEQKMTSNSNRNGTTHDRHSEGTEKSVTSASATAAIDLTKIYNTTAESEDNELQIVFSTGCKQGNRKLLAITLQISASTVGQRGRMTEIISGCSEEDMAQIALEPTFYFNMHRHFTPDYSEHPEPNITDSYTPYNKPYGLRHFLKNANPQIRGNPPIALVDGDFIFFKPLRVNTGTLLNKYYTGPLKNTDIYDVVKDGVAIAQDWSVYIGGGWLNDDSTVKKQICPGKPCMNVSQQDGKDYYAGTGPPYIVTKNDMLKMADDYCSFVVEGRKVDKNWMVEMFGYGLAAANHGIKHTLVNNIGITHPTYKNGEYWNFIDDKFGNPCASPVDVLLPPEPPVGLHYCQIYGFVRDPKIDWRYYKYLLPNNILDCDSMMIAHPPPSEWTDIEKQNLSPEKRLAKRHEVWTECTMIKIVNQALTKAKTRTCPNGFNTNRGIPINLRDGIGDAYPTKKPQ